MCVYVCVHFRTYQQHINNTGLTLSSFLKTVYAASPAQHYEHHMAYCPTYIFGGGTWDTMHGSEDPTWYKGENRLKMKHVIDTEEQV